MSQSPSMAERSRSVDVLCDRFEEALLKGERPSLNDWLRQAGALADQALPELALVELEYRLTAGEAGTAAEYLERYPGLAADAEAAVRLVAAEFRVKRLSDPSVNEAAFRRRYPALANRPEWSNGPWVVGSPQHTMTFTGDPTPSHSKPTSVGRFPYDLFSPPQQPDEIGRIDGYRILRILGEGGMGVVLEGEEIELKRRVAIKLMKPDHAANSIARERFKREAQAAAAIEHPRVVVIYAVGEVQGTPYFAMRLMKGRPLGDQLKDSKPLPLVEAVRYAREMAEGLAAAHARDLTHRDIKPDNTWLEETAIGTHAVLLDFGLVHSTEGETLTQANAIMGTPAYMAPEQAAGLPVDAKADLFSLGCVLYQMVTGTKPFKGPSIMAILSALENHHPPRPHTLNATVPTALSDLVDQLLSKSPNGRPASAAEVAERLQAIEQSLPENTPTDTWRPAPVQPSKPKKTKLAWLAGIAVAVVGIGIAVAVSRPTKSPEPTPDPSANAPPSDAAKEFRLVSVDLKHYEALGNGKQHFVGLLGEKTFDAHLNDRIRVEAKLSRPGYAYLLAFRPDGQYELCLPVKDTEAPVLSDTIIYHPTESDTAYGLDEGTGLWVFSVVASETPLPPYREWKKKLETGINWRHAQALPGTVWYDDGTSLQARTANGLESNTRAAGARLDTPDQQVKVVTDSLNRVGRDLGVKVTSVGFGAGQKK